MIETKVEGDPGSVRGAASWLRDSLRRGTDAAADDTARARQVARGGWEGEASESYQSFLRPVVTATDDHVARIGRAASAFDHYAVCLRTAQDDMANIRRSARAGGLTVNGTVILPPPPAPPPPILPDPSAQAAHQAAVDKINLYNALASEASGVFDAYLQWIESHLPRAQTDAEEDSGLGEYLGELESNLPNLYTGLVAGAGGAGMARLSQRYAKDAAAYRRKTRNSGDPRVRNRLNTSKGRSDLERLLRNVRNSGRAGRLLLGPAGPLIDVGYGVHQGASTGDWTRAALTTGASLGTAAAVGVLMAGAPVLATVGVAGLAAWGVSSGVGLVYDNWDDITEWTSDAADNVKDFAADTWDDTTDAVGEAWDAVTPW